MWFYILTCSISVVAGFLLHALLSARPLAELGDAAAYWHRRAKAAEARLARLARPAEVLPLTYQPSMAQQRHGLSVVQGGRR